MSTSRNISLFVLACVVAAPAALAGGRNPGSVLVFPVQRSGVSPTETGNSAFFTIINVTNINTTPQNPSSFGGSTGVHYQYANTINNPADIQQPLGCIVFDRHEFLTPADTLSVLTTCHNAAFAPGQAGYLVVSAENPSAFNTPWSHNFLIGSELVVNASGGIYSLNALPFEAVPAQGANTDVNLNGRLDFDGAEYEGTPETLYIDSFIALAGSQLALINLTGGPSALATAQIDIWNDNEFALSTTKVFKCWFDVQLTSISPLFSSAFLSNNTPDDPRELDLDCNGINDVETGWARIEGIVAQTPFGAARPNPAFLGSITSGPATAINGGHLLWESKAKQLNGSFMEP